MTQMNMSSMMKGANHQHQNSSRHESHSHKESKGTGEVGQMIKQAFTAVQPNQTNQHQSPTRTHQPRESYAQSLHIDENVMNVMDDESIQQVINDIEHK